MASGFFVVEKKWALVFSGVLYLVDGRRFHWIGKKATTETVPKKCVVFL